MKLNTNKSNIMIFNETIKYQFSTRLELENSIIETVNNTKLLGVNISSDLTWHKNTKQLVKQAYQRIIILRKLFEFNMPVKDLLLYFKFCIT